MSESYKAAGVDITAGYKAVELIKKRVASTYNEGVVSDIGDFGGLYDMGFLGMRHPILVGSTDGVGTKLRLAIIMDKHDTIGIDCVAMCVNDVLCSGARPLFFLDYIALGKNVPERVDAIVAGVVEGCRQAGTALIGGETAEMPGSYPPDEYDLAGFTVGAVEKDEIFDKNRVKIGDVLIALPSSGIHSNGYSLVRKIFDVENRDLNEYVDELSGTLGEALLTPTRIYVSDFMKLRKIAEIKSAANITGGGFYENLPRSLPAGLSYKIKETDVRVLPIFDYISKTGGIPERDMFNTFNMGVGMTVTVAPQYADAVLNTVEGTYILGEVVGSDEGVILCE